MIPTIKTRLLLIAFLSVQLLNAQTTSGKVINSKTKEPLAGASIQIINSKKGTTTDKDGFFTIKNNKKPIRISYLGYNPKIITSSKTDLIIKLKPLNSNLKEVVIKAKTKARVLKESSMPVSVITIKDIQGTVSNTQELLAKTAGITIRRTGGVGSVSRISIRGLEGKRIGYFINSKPMSDNTDFLDLNDIPIDLIDRIEIYKGIVPGKLGGSAIGGAVNIITREYPSRHIDLSYSTASYNEHRVSAVTKFNNEDQTYNYGFGGFYTSSDNDYKMKLPFREGYVTRENDRFEKLLFGGGFSTKKWYFDELEVKPLLALSKKEIQGIERKINEAYSYTQSFAISSTLEKTNFLIAGLDLNFSGLYTYSYFGLVDKALQRQKWDGSYIDTESIYGGEIGNHPSDSKNKKHSVINRLNLDYTINNNHSINLNLTYNFARGEPKDELRDKSLRYRSNFNILLKSGTSNLTYTYRSNNDKWLSATVAKGYFFSTKTKTINTNTGITTPTDVNINKTDFGFNQSFRYRFNKNLLAKLSGAYDIRMPTELELIGDSFNIQPAGNLVPERNLSFNIGSYYSKKLSNKRKLQIEANVFYSYLKNMIRFTGNNLNSKYENFDKMRSIGTDIDIKYDISPSVYLFSNATLQDLRDAQKFRPGSTVASAKYNLRMPHIPYFYANAGFEFHKENLFGGKNQNFKWFTTASYVHEYFYDFKVSKFQERKIPTSLAFDTGIENSWRNGNTSLGIQVNNITNQTLISEFNRPLPGITYAIKLRHIIN